VYALVQEVSIRTTDGVKEPKATYLIRVMKPKRRAKRLKLRIGSATSSRWAS